MLSEPESRETDSARGSGDHAGGRRGLLVSVVAVTLIFAAVAGSLWRAPLYGEDPLVLSFFKDDGVREAMKDFARPQYGLSSVRFYRPLTSLSLALQGAASWDPAWLRSANLLVYWIGAISTVVLARRLGAKTLGAVFAGAWVALFPGGPGDWCWVIGRVDAFSFGFGMAGLAVLATAGLRGSRTSLAASAALFLAAFFSKETAVVLPVAAVALGAALGGRAGALRALVPSAAVAAAFVVRRLALGFWGGGYVGGPAGPDLFAGAIGPTLVSGIVSLLAGVPRASALWVLLAFFALAAARALGDRAVGRRLLALAAGGAALYVVGALPITGEPELVPLHARTFPAVHALAGIGIGLLLDAPRVPARLAQVLAVALLAFPAIALEESIRIYESAAALYGRDRERIEAARAASPALPAPFFAEGALQLWTLERPTAPLYVSGVGLSRRFEPPFAPAGASPVWPLRPVDVQGRGEPLHVASKSPFAARVVRDPEHRPQLGVAWREGEVQTITLPPDALPSRLTGADAIAMANQQFDRDLKLPPAPPGSMLRIAVFTAVGFGVGRADPKGLTWKRLLTTTIAGAFPLYQLPGLAVDFRETRFWLRFEWLDADDRVLAESALIPVEMGPDFADVIREGEADRQFGLRGG